MILTTYAEICDNASKIHLAHYYYIKGNDGKLVKWYGDNWDKARTHFIKLTEIAPAGISYTFHAITASQVAEKILNFFSKKG